MGHLRIDIQDGPLKRRLVGAADRLGCPPDLLCRALITVIFRDDVMNGILDGDDPRDICPQGGRRAINYPPGERQSRVLAYFAAHAGEDGVIRVPLSRMARDLDTKNGSLCNAIRALIRRGLIRKVARGCKGTPTIYCLVPEPAHV